MKKYVLAGNARHILYSPNWLFYKNTRRNLSQDHFPQHHERIYVFENDGNTHRIRVANADGSEEKVISTYSWESDPSWIPEAVP
jgi:hypothetical protein